MGATQGKVISGEWHPPKPQFGASLAAVKQAERDQVSGSIPSLYNDANLMRSPDYWIYIFNISKQEFARYRPTDFPKIELKACAKDQKCRIVCRVPNIVNLKIPNLDTGQMTIVGIPGERFATDLVNPANLSNNMWNAFEDPNVTWLDGGSDDLSRRGVFWTTTVLCSGCRKQIAERFDGHLTRWIHQDGTEICDDAVPEATDEDMERARTRMEKHYQAMIDQADELAGNNQRSDIGKEAHIAADYFFKVSTSWHHTVIRPATCPNCGDQISSGIAYHISQSIGSLCIIDWKRAVMAGVKKREDVPAELRWWDDETIESVMPDQPHRGPGRPRKEI